MSQYSKPHCHLLENVRVELHLSNCATKFDVKKEQVLIHRHLQKKFI